MERTYIMLKPDALRRGLTGDILSRIEHKGYRITAMKTMQLDEPILREHYAHIADCGIYDQRARAGNDCRGGTGCKGDAYSDGCD